jgi:hypothetical protein
MTMQELMPLLARHEGVWEGTYRYYNAAGEKIDEHASKLTCEFPTSGPYPYHQKNYYTWPDGRTEMRDFPAIYKDGRIWWDNELINGWAAEMTLDTHNRTMVLYWQRTNDPSTYLYEMIQLSDCGKFRGRTWHWIKNGQIFQRTLIDEIHVADKVS